MVDRVIPRITEPLDGVQERFCGSVEINLFVFVYGLHKLFAGALGDVMLGVGARFFQREMADAAIRLRIEVDSRKRIDGIHRRDPDDAVILFPLYGLDKRSVETVETGIVLRLIHDKGAGSCVDTAMTAADVDAKVAAAEDNFYVVVRNDGEADNAAIARGLGENAAAKGDICVIKTALGSTPESYSFMGYVYDGANWGAMDGNINSENVIIGKDIVFAGSYASVGNVAKGTTIAKGDTLNKFLERLFTQELNPGKPTPTCSVTLTGAGAKEVGSTFTPSYTTSFDKKAYAYAPTDTGVTVSAWSVTDSNSVEKTSATGSFEAFTVGDATSYKLTAKATYTDGVVPVTNLGNPYPASQIKAGTTAAASSGTVTGYRNWYMYIGTDNTSAINSAFIRGTTAKGTGKSASTQNNVTIPAGTKRVMIAIPSGSGYTKQLKSVIDVDGMGLDVFSNFAESTVSVEGANSYAGMNYRVYVAENANGMSATHYNFVIG